MKFFKPKIFLYIFLVIFLIEIFDVIYYLRTDFLSYFLASIDPAVLVDFANEDREAVGIITLQWDPLLERAAYLKAKHMAENGYFAHTSPDGITPWDWLEKVDYDFSYAGENLAVNFTDSTKLYAAWINSPSHKANIMSYNFTRIGIAQATGLYKGREATFVVQFFAKPWAWGKKTVSEAKTEINAPVTEKISSQEETTVLGEELTKKPRSIKNENYESFISVMKTKDDKVSAPILRSLTERDELQYKPLIEKIMPFFDFNNNIGYLWLLGIFVSITLGLKAFMGNKIKFSEAVVNFALILLVAGFSFYFNSLVTTTLCNLVQSL